MMRRIKRKLNGQACKTRKTEPTKEEGKEEEEEQGKKTKKRRAKQWNSSSNSPILMRNYVVKCAGIFFTVWLAQQQHRHHHVRIKRRYSRTDSIIHIYLFFASCIFLLLDYYSLFRSQKRIAGIPECTEHYVIHEFNEVAQKCKMKNESRVRRKRNEKLKGRKEERKSEKKTQKPKRKRGIFSLHKNRCAQNTPFRRIPNCLKSTTKCEVLSASYIRVKELSWWIFENWTWKSFSFRLSSHHVVYKSRSTVGAEAWTFTQAMENKLAVS